VDLPGGGASAHRVVMAAEQLACRFVLPLPLVEVHSNGPATVLRVSNPYDRAGPDLLLVRRGVADHAPARVLEALIVRELVRMAAPRRWELVNFWMRFWGGVGRIAYPALALATALMAAAGEWPVWPVGMTAGLAGFQALAAWRCRAEEYTTDDKAAALVGASMVAGSIRWLAEQTPTATQPARLLQLLRGPWSPRPAARPRLRRLGCVVVVN
jgi:hypothetical protein